MPAANDSETGLTAVQLRSLLDYDPATGVFRWKVSPTNIVAVGSRAGHIVRQNGRRRIVIARRPYFASRLAWLYMTDEWPSHEIDHIDLNRANDAWSNLRLATRSQNCANQRVRGASGFKGVVWHRRDKRWQASIKVNGKNKHLGLFDTPNEAHAAYCAAARKHFGEFARVA